MIRSEMHEDGTPETLDLFFAWQNASENEKSRREASYWIAHANKHQRDSEIHKLYYQLSKKALEKCLVRKCTCGVEKIGGNHSLWCDSR